MVQFIENDASFVLPAGKVSVCILCASIHSGVSRGLPTLQKVRFHVSEKKFLNIF